MQMRLFPSLKVNLGKNLPQSNQPVESREIDWSKFHYKTGQIKIPPACDLCCRSLGW